MSDIDTVVVSEPIIQVVEVVTQGQQGIPGVAGALNDISDVTITTPSNGQSLVYQSGVWVNQTVSGSGGTLNDLTDVTITTPANGQALVYQSGTWVNQTVSTVGTLNDLTDVVISSPVNNHVLVHNGTNWVNRILSHNDLSDLPETYPPAPHTHPASQITDFSAAADARIAAASIDALADVIINVPGANHFLRYNDVDFRWENTVFITSYIQGFNTDVDARIAAASINALSDVTISSPATGQVLRYNGSAWVNAVLAYSDLSGSVPAHTHAAADVTSGTFDNARISQSSVTQHQAALAITASQMSDFNSSADARIAAASVNALADVTISSPATAQVLRYNGSAWVNAALGYTDLTGVPSTFAPSAHNTSHQSGGGDAIKLDDLAAPDDNTDLNATTSAHGLLRKLSNDATQYLDGTGAFTVPAPVRTTTTVYTPSGSPHTVAVPTGAVMLEYVVIAGGGGGGSGRCGATSSTRAGGGGGAGAGMSKGTAPVSGITGSLTLTVGTGGTGALGVGSTGNGSSGNAGTESSIYHNSNTVVLAWAGPGGGGGGGTSTAGGTAGTAGRSGGGPSANSGTIGGATTNGNSGSNALGCGAGGGGGCISSGNTVFDGGAGGSSNYTGLPGSLGGAGGIGDPGTDGQASPFAGAPGTGAGGGGSDGSGAGGAGGNATTGCGGGGGAGATNGVGSSGPGGNGGDGIIVLIWHY